MRVAALISGGKDSTYNMMQCIAAGHEIVALANLYPASSTEVDSYMYQSVGYEAIGLIAEAMELPLYRRATAGQSMQRGKVYVPRGVDGHDEVEDLYELLVDVKNEVAIEAVSVGAILSDYQRVRVENVCIRLGLVPLCYLWQRNQQELLAEMIKCEIDAIIIKVAALGLEPSRHLGRSLRLIEPHLQDLHEKYGINVCGEGGEYETLTLDCPLFKSRIVIDESEVILHSEDTIAQVGFMKLIRLHLEVKLPPLDLNQRLAALPLKDSDGYVTDIGEEASEFEDEGVIDTPEEAGDLDCVTASYTGYVFPHLAAKSGDGWLWIGGLSSQSEDPLDAMKEIMDKLKCVLDEHEQSLTDVCSISMFISDMSQYGELNDVYCERLNHVNPPTRACVQVPLPTNCPVIMQAVSWKLPQSMVVGDSVIERHTMHVQSISHWAPANIGPYSQAVKIGDIIHLAGQIALVPGSMVMVKGGIKQQCRLALRNVDRLLSAIDVNTNVRSVVQGVCYVTNIRSIQHARKLWEERTNSAIVNYVVVSNLPKSAAVEWHVWAHKHNNQFEYEETGKCLDEWSISIYRRWNYENNIAAVVCHVGTTADDHAALAFSAHIFEETVRYTLQKLQQGHENDSTSIYNLKIFYPLNKNIRIEDEFLAVLEGLKESFCLVFTIVPVIGLKSENTYLSISGVRNQ